MENLKPYAAYRDSGLPWLGEIPVSWEVRRNGRLFQQRNETGFPDLPILEVSLRTGVRIRNFNSSNRKQVMSDRDKYKRARKGDIAYNMMRMWQGAVGVVPEDGLISPAYIVAKPLPDTDARYFEYLFRTGSYMDEVNKFSRGIVSDRNRLYWEDFKQMPSPVPPPAEQAAIARFLDHADRRIRRYIRAKRKLIELLGEQKQALIHQAVTRGLDPHVKLKPSGLEWLGDVPEHWEVRKLRSIFRNHGSGTTPSGDQYYGGDIPWVMTGDLTDDIVSQTKRSVTRDAIERFSALKLYNHDSLLVAMYGATIGKTGITTMPVCTNQACCVLADPIPSVDVRFVQAVVNIARSHLIQQSYGGGQPNINADIVRSLRVPVPPLVEQSKIAETILSATCDDGLDRAVREIELISEYRTRLIVDVVTGKLDVREAAAQLDEQVAEKPSKWRSGKEPNKHFYRSVLAAEIVNRHQGERRFGRIKLQKALVLAEYHLQLTEIQSDLKRAAAGPFDNKMMRSIESQLKKQKWFDSVATEGKGTQIEYRPLEKRGGHQTYFDRYWGSKQADFDRLMSLLKPMRTIQAEIVATLYSAWNDFLIDGEQFDDDRLVAEVLTNWHPKKERITRDRWQKAIQWMREKELVPTGFGAHTQQNGAEA